VIDVLVSGRLRGAPQLRRAANGSPFATFRVAAASKNSESLLCSCVTFSKSSIEAVQSLEDGDSIAVSGEGAIGGWSATDGSMRHGLEVTAHAVMTMYHAGRKRKGGSAASDGLDDES